MSDFYKKTGYTPFQQETQWLNLCMGAHDQICFCDKPWMHLLQSTIQRGNFFDLDQKQVRLIQRCLTTMSGEKDTSKDHTPENTGKEDKENEDFDFDIGELERLFNEDGEQG